MEQLEQRFHRSVCNVLTFFATNQTNRRHRRARKRRAWKAAAIATHSGWEDKQTVTDIAAEEATAITSPEEEISRLQLLLIAEQAATATAIAAAEEAAATATSLEVENRRQQLLLAATAAKVRARVYHPDDP
jgi:hypothetical protein